MTFKTEQEAFWAGDFGTEYIQRNQGDALLASNLDYVGYTQCQNHQPKRLLVQF